MTLPETESAPAMSGPTDEGELLRDLYDRYAPGVFRMAYRLTGSRADAEDVVQDVFVGLPTALRGYTDEWRVSTGSMPKIDGVMLDRALRFLPETFRTLVLLREVEGYSHPESHAPQPTGWRPPSPPATSTRSKPAPQRTSSQRMYSGTCPANGRGYEECELLSPLLAVWECHPPISWREPTGLAKFEVLAPRSYDRASWSGTEDILVFGLDRSFESIAAEGSTDDGRWSMPATPHIGMQLGIALRSP